MASDAVFFVGNIPVYVRALPSGDITVWHPFNQKLRSIVEPICRGKGYWQGNHRNWIVHERWAREVISELAKVGERYV